MALIEVQDASVVNTGEPFGKDRVRIVRREAEMTFGDGDAEPGVFLPESFFEPEELVLDARPNHGHEFFPGALGLGLISYASQDGVRLQRRLAHHVDGDEIEMFSGSIQ